MFPDGMFANYPSEKAPKFIKANVGIDRDALIRWLQTQDERVFLTLKESKGGKLYFAVDDFTPKKHENKEPVDEKIDINKYF